MTCITSCIINCITNCIIACIMIRILTRKTAWIVTCIITYIMTLQFKWLVLTFHSFSWLILTFLFPVQLVLVFPVKLRFDLTGLVLSWLVLTSPYFTGPGFSWFIQFELCVLACFDFWCLVPTKMACHDFSFPILLIKKFVLTFFDLSSIVLTCHDVLLLITYNNHDIDSLKV